MNAPERIVSFSNEISDMLDEFTKFMFKHLYFHPKVSETTQKRVDSMKNLFLFYIENPQALGAKAQKFIETQGLYRSVCDYVAGCTDRFALKECEKYGLLNE